MKKIFCLLLIIGLAAFSANKTYAYNENFGLTDDSEVLKAGAAGAQFLKVGVGARAMAMGGAYSSIADDPTAMYWNPAGLANVQQVATNFSWSNWFANYKHNFAAVSIPFSRSLVVGFNMVSFGTDRVEVSTLEDPNTGTYYSINDLSFAATVAGYLTQEFSFGFTARYSRNAFADLSAGGVSFDFGTMYNTGILNNMKLSFAIQNLGPQMEYSGKDLYTTKKLVEDLTMSGIQATYISNPYSIPLTFRAGLSSFIYDNDEYRWLLAGDFVTISDAAESYHVGTEFTYLVGGFDLSARSGFTVNHDQVGYAGGVGLSYDMNFGIGRLDYCFIPSKDFGVISKITASFNMK